MTRPLPSFDPRQVPVVTAEDDRLLRPAPSERLTPQGLRERFSSPPPWTPELRREPLFADRTPAHAAVLLPLVMRDELMLLLTQRTEHLSTHSGQIALPGGKMDEGDADATAAALRETHEEIGLPADRIEVIGALPEYITGTAFIVTPVVGLVSPDIQLRPNPHEVADVFEVPLSFLMDPAHHRRHRLLFQGHEREWYSMPFADGPRERFIWGATAGMLRNLYRFLTA
ncbi:MAG: CoA pyrophosphatase [Hydrogenophaga sp.]|jgi:8-oxo-dGTP pyrophosphatase MutT (NUDIX family)|nr:CoA pyrophosphatase [Hydrogenophaga sp.]